MESTRPFDRRVSLGFAPGVSSSGQTARSASAGLNQSPTHQSSGLDLYMHPFKVLVNDAKIYVMPGWVYGVSNSQILWKNQVQMNSSNLGDPFLGVTMPTLNWAVGRLYLKITIANGSINACEILFETEANAVDSLTVRWLFLAETKADYLIEQHLKSDVFLTVIYEGWCHVTFGSITGPAAGTVNISAGCVMVSKVGALSGTSPVPDKTLTRLKNGSGDFLPELETGVAVINGDKIFVLLTYTAGTYGTSSIPYYECTDAEYIVNPGPMTDSATASYIHVADIIIVSSKMTIKPKAPGVITAPTLIFPLDPSVENDGEDYWTTKYVSNSSVRIKRGALVSYNYYLSTPGTVVFQQSLQEIWLDTSGASTSQDILITGITEDDFLWVEIPLLASNANFTTTGGTPAPTPDHTHQVPTTFGQVQGGASEPFINFGATVTMTDDVIKLPFAQLVDGRVKQLHTGLLTCPPLFSLAAL